ncbi:VanZ family protein [Acidobacteriota bacterium]
MDTATSKTKNLNPFGLVLLIYIISIILIITFTPFQFEFSEKILFKWGSNVHDTINNIFLFIPFGFFFHLTLRRKKTSIVMWNVLVLSFLFSALIEFFQSFLIGRTSTIMDLFTNTMGAFVGAIIFLLAKKRLHEESVGLFTLELPLFHVVYLLVPLIWLNGLASGEDEAHVWPIVLLGSIGGIVLAAIFKHRHQFAAHFSPTSLALSAMAWFFLASVPAFFQSHLLVMIFGLFVGLIVFLLSERKVRNSEDRRFEIPTLKRILPIFFLYLSLIVFWPLKIPQLNFKFVMGIESLSGVVTAGRIFYLLEFIAAITLLGYILAEISGRWTEKSKNNVTWIYFLVITIAAELEFIRSILQLQSPAPFFDHPGRRFRSSDLSFSNQRN